MNGRRARAARRERQDAQALGFLSAFGAIARAMFARLAPPFYRANPDAPRPCATCWAHEKPDGWQGWDSTTAGLMDSVRGRARFVCHHGAPCTEDGWDVDPETAPPCAAFGVLMTRPDEAQEAVVMAALQTMPPGEKGPPRMTGEALRKAARRLAHHPATQEETP